jgi:hypothetical protein
MAGLAGLSLLFVIFGLVLVVCWIILPFAIIGTKRRLDLILEEQRRTNVFLSAITKRNPGSVPTAGRPPTWVVRFPEVALMRIELFIVTFVTLWYCSSAQPEEPGKDPAHRRGVCGEIRKLDLLLYDDPRQHAPTASCSYTDSRLLVTPRGALPPERMKRFVLLAFATVGKLYNDDFALPTEVYAGFGSECQVMTTRNAALLQRSLRRGDDLGMVSALQMASTAPKVPCPK